MLGHYGFNGSQRQYDLETELQLGDAARSLHIINPRN